MQRIRLILVDDNARYRASLAILLAQLPNIQVIAEAENGAQALELAMHLRPDLMLIDIVMPGMSGIDLTRQLKTARHPPQVVLLTMHTVPGYRTAALEAGADAFLAKDEVATALAPIISRLFPKEHPHGPPGPAD